MKLKKILSLALALSFGAALCACSAKPDDASKTDSGLVSEPEESGEESIVELPFTPISRPELKSDDMESLCSPHPTGDFIQSWMCATWSAKQWESHCKMLKKAGFDFIILQYSTSKENGKYTSFYYPSEYAKDKDYSSTDVKVYNCIENLMKGAEAAGDFKVYIALGGCSDWWGYPFTDFEWCRREAEITNKLAEEIYDLYKEKYNDIFAGWYWAWEMFTCKEKYEKNWADMININLDFLTELDSTMPCIFSPFISSYENAPAERIGEMYTYLCENVRFRKGDILAPQDGFGTLTKEFRPDLEGTDNARPYTLEFIEDMAFEIKKAADKNENLSLWYNVENFGGTSEKGTAELNRYVDQMNICSKFAEGLITFSYSHYYNPNQVASSYNTDYIQYIKWLSQQRIAEI